MKFIYFLIISTTISLLLIWLNYAFMGHVDFKKNNNYIMNYVAQIEKIHSSTLVFSGKEDYFLAFLKNTCSYNNKIHLSEYNYSYDIYQVRCHE